MFLVHYHWRRIYLYPGLILLILFMVLGIINYQILFELKVPLLWGGLIAIAFSSFVFIALFVRRYSIYKCSKQIIRVRDDFLNLTNEDITIHYTQIKCLKLYNNGLGEIYTGHENYKVIVISIDMINYQMLIDWIKEKGIEINDNLRISFEP